MTELFAPPTPDYDFTPPEGITLDAELVSDYQAQARRIGLSPEQARALFVWWTERSGRCAASDQQSVAAQRAETEAILRREWGRAYETQLDLARRAVRRFGGEELSAALERSRLGDDPAVIRAFAAIGSLVAEPALVGRGSGGFGMTPAQARGEIARLKTDAGFLSAYTDLRHPSHDDSVRRMVALQAALG